MKIESFRAGGTKYSAENGDLLTVEFPFINILAMDFKEFKNSDLELLKIIYPYRYKKNENLLDDITKLQGIIEELLNYINEFNNKDQIVIGHLLNNLFADIHKIAEENSKEKAVEVMATAESTLSDKLIAQSKKINSIEIAKGMLEDDLDINFISKYTGLTPEEIQELEQEL